MSASRSQARTLRLVARLGRVTVADLMREEGYSTREAIGHLRELVAAGTLHREPVEKRQPLYWRQP